MSIESVVYRMFGRTEGNVDAANVKRRNVWGQDKTRGTFLSSRDWVGSFGVDPKMSQTVFEPEEESL